LNNKTVPRLIGAWPSQPHHTAEQKHKAELVMEFYQKFVIEGDLSLGPRFIDDPYVQHNAIVDNGLEGVMVFVKDLRGKYPQMTFEFKRVLVDGDYVLLHSHVITKPGQRGVSVFDLFRLNGDKLAEHWDVIQNIPEKSVSGNTMF